MKVPYTIKHLTKGALEIIELQYIGTGVSAREINVAAKIQSNPCLALKVFVNRIADVQ